MSDLEKLPPDFIKTFIRPISMLNFYGIRIFEDKNASYFTRNRRFIFFLILVLPMFINQVLYLLWSDRTGASFLDVVNALPCTLIIMQDLVKMAVAASKKDDIRKFIIEISEVWPTDTNDPKKEEVLRNWTRRLKYYENAYITFVSIVLPTFEAMPLIVSIYSFTSDKPVYEFPVQLYCFSWLTSHYQYAAAYVYLLITCTTIHLCIYIAGELLLFAVTFNISALLNLLQNDLENFEKSPENNFNNPLEDDCEDIKNFVITHQKLLTLVERLNEIFGIIIFTQVSFSSVVICCFGFLVVVAEKMLARNVTAVFGLLYAIFILAWLGQILFDTSTSLANAAYNCPWYERGIKFRKYIAIILIRCQAPCCMTALGFSTLTLALFSKVLSTSWSYISLLNQMYEDVDNM